LKTEKKQSPSATKQRHGFYTHRSLSRPASSAARTEIRKRSYQKHLHPFVMGGRNIKQVDLDANAIYSQSWQAPHAAKVDRAYELSYNHNGYTFQLLRLCYIWGRLGMSRRCSGGVTTRSGKDSRGVLVQNNLARDKGGLGEHDQLSMCPSELDWISSIVGRSHADWRGGF
jgi:hypothetical protein